MVEDLAEVLCAYLLYASGCRCCLSSGGHCRYAREEEKMTKRRKRRMRMWTLKSRFELRGRNARSFQLDLGPVRTMARAARLQE
jgi:hypothetical protein